MSSSKKLTLKLPMGSDELISVTLNEMVSVISDAKFTSKSLTQIIKDRLNVEITDKEKTSNG